MCVCAYLCVCFDIMQKVLLSFLIESNSPTFSLCSFCVSFLNFILDFLLAAAGLLCYVVLCASLPSTLRYGTADSLCVTAFTVYLCVAPCTCMCTLIHIYCCCCCCSYNIVYSSLNARSTRYTQRRRVARDTLYAYTPRSDSFCNRDSSRT